MRRLLTLILAIPLVIGIGGCATDGVFDFGKTATTSVHLKLLDAEFDRAVATIESLDTNEAESKTLDESIYILSAERLFLRTLHKQSAGRIALTAVQAQLQLDQIAQAYTMGKAAYVDYLNRTGGEVNPLLQSFDDSAVIAHGNIQESITSGSVVTSFDIAEYMGLALRVLAAVNGVPI